MDRLITSFSNEKIKLIRRLRDKKTRDEGSLFLAEGIRVVMEAVQQNAEIATIMYCPALVTSDLAKQFLKSINRQKIEIIEVNEEIFRRLANKEGPQGLIAVIRQKWFDLEQLSFNKSGIWVALDSIQDPGNLGSIMRTLEAVGGEGIVLLDQTTDGYHPTVVRASTGAIFSQKLVRTSTDNFVKWKENHTVALIGTTCDHGDDYKGVVYPKKLILLLGSEQKGLYKKLKRICDSLIKIPMQGRVDSLNLACAASIVLYEIYNQHRLDIQ